MVSLRSRQKDELSSFFWRSANTYYFYEVFLIPSSRRVRYIISSSSQTFIVIGDMGDWCWAFPYFEGSRCFILNRATRPFGLVRFARNANLDTATIDKDIQRTLLAAENSIEQSIKQILLFVLSSTTSYTRGELTRNQTNKERGRNGLAYLAMKEAVSRWGLQILKGSWRVM